MNGMGQLWGKVNMNYKDFLKGFISKRGKCSMSAGSCFIDFGDIGNNPYARECSVAEVYDDFILLKYVDPNGSYYEAIPISNLILRLSAKDNVQFGKNISM